MSLSGGIGSRCGKSEEAHSIMKEDLAGGKLPSGLFGANAAWWQIMILAFNVNSAMKRLVLGESWVNRRMKAIRFWLINVPGRVLRQPELVVRLVGGHPSNEILLEARRRMVMSMRFGLMTEHRGRPVALERGLTRVRGDSSFRKQPESGGKHTVTRQS